MASASWAFRAIHRSTSCLFSALTFSRSLSDMVSCRESAIISSWTFYAHVISQLILSISVCERPLPGFPDGSAFHSYLGQLLRFAQLVVPISKLGREATSFGCQGLNRLCVSGGLSAQLGEFLFCGTQAGFESSLFLEGFCELDRVESSLFRGGVTVRLRFFIS